ncbi:MAG: hypothetical protein KAR13_03590, partial [Desulfobulbaceae bacterium]|nr:hypothetical protein [Desulfobulbaceae bacterium]
EFKGSSTGLISTIIPLEDTSTSILVEKTKKQVIKNFGPSAGEKEVEFDSSMIFPLMPEVVPEDLGEVLEEDERNLYGLIRNRAIACMMREADIENIKVELRAGECCLFRKSMRSVKEKGFLAVYQGCHDRGLVEPCPLANLEQGRIVETLQIIPEQSSAFPPEYYTLETLFTDLADFSILVDRSSIFMVQSMLDRGYITMTQQGDLRCNDNVIKVVSAINRAFPSMTGLNFSAYFEQTVSEAESGRKPIDVALKQFDQALMMHGKVLAKSKAPASIPQRSRKRLSKTIIKTPIVAEPEKSSFEKVEDKASLPAEVPEPEVVVQDAESPVSEEVGVEEAVLPEVVESVPEPVSEQEEAPIEEPEEVDVEESVSEPEPEPEP